MSLYGALFSGVAGLASQSSAMGAISDNISNVNTIGYKGAQVNFQTLVTKQVSLTEYSPGGVQSKPRANVDVQGLLQATSSSTDLALSGQGMFVVNTNSDPAATGSGMFGYTRAGSFKVDKDGYLQNVSGFYMQGWPLTATDNTNSAKPTEVTVDGNTYMKAYKDTTGAWHYVNQNIINPQEVKPLNLKTIGGSADPTSQIKMGANLPAGDTIYDPTKPASSTGLHQTSVLLYDSLGDTHSVDINWMKTNSNAWNIQEKTNVYSLSGSLTDTSATPDLTADIAVNGTNVVTNGGATGMAFFAGSGVMAFSSAADANTLPLGTVFTVAGAEDTANNGTYQVKTGTSTSTFANNAVTAPGTVTFNGVSTTYANTAFSAAAAGPPATGTIDLGAAVSPAMPVGTIFYMKNATNSGYYQVTTSPSLAGPNAIDVQACSTVAIQNNVFADQRGVTPPPGASSATLFDAADNVYASQGRLDFTQASRNDVLALDGKQIKVTNPANNITTTFQFDATGTIPLAAGAIRIDLTNPTVTAGTQVASAVLAQMRTPANYIGTGTIATGDTIPLFEVNGATLNIVQQVGGKEFDFDVSTLGSSITQSQTRQWSPGPPPVDGVTGTFNVRAITQNGDAMTFNGDGTPKTVNVSKLEMTLSNGAESMTAVGGASGAEHRINVFLGSPSKDDGMTQLGGTYQLAYLTQNGAKFGNFSGVSVGSDGVVTALFDNGVRRPVFQIPIATFTNPNGLESLTGNTFIETDVSGSYTLRAAGDAGSGSVQSASLEASTVDIGTEFTTMIVTQRAYSAAAKIITTADQMLDELIQIKR
jgi:flagellar hook protein FlgE